MKLSFTTLDAFSDIRYKGNPVAIISVPASLKSTLSQTQKQSIASEFNLSEIVFMHLPATPSTERTIDIFTSLAEVPFAGHPTIGSSHYLLKVLKEDVSALVTKAGKVPIWVDGESGNVKAQIPYEYHEHGVTCGREVNGRENPTVSIVNGMSFVMVELETLEDLGKAKGNLAGNTFDPSPLDEGWQNGLIGTMYFVAQETDDLGRKRCRTRMFGTREDPGTGSASSALGCLLALREGKGASKFAFEQGVEMGRRNEIEVEVVTGESGVEKVLLSGAAVKVMEGSLEI